MTEANVIELPVKPKPSRRKKARRAASPKPAAKMPDELTGLTASECPVECSVKGCVISGRSYCAHPRKGGLHGSDMCDPAAVDRAQRARKALAHIAVDKRD